MDWEAIKNTVVNWLSTNGWNIVTAILIFVLGIFVIKLLMRLARKFFSKTKLEKAAQGFVLSILKFVLWLVLLLAVVSALGISITGFVVVVSAASLAISLSLQSCLSNLVNGFVIISTQVFKEGDYVVIGGQEGTIKTIKMMYTVLQTGDGKIITIPNANVMTKEVVNYTTMPIRRLDLKFDVSYSSDIDKVKEVITNVILTNENILADPEPLVTLFSLNASSVTILARVWVENKDYWSTNWYLLDHIFNELKRNNVNIPYNQLDVFVKPNQDPTVYREEPLPEKKELKVIEKKDSSFLDELGIKKIDFKKLAKAKKKSAKNKTKDEQKTNNKKK